MSDGTTKAMKSVTTTLPTNSKKLDKEVDKIGKQLEESKTKELPDDYIHQKISFLKSTIRIIGYVFIPFSLVTATILLIISEIIGIIEELV